MTARPGHAADRQVPNLDKNPVFHYTFHQETAIQTTSRGRVPQSPEKRFPINPIEEWLRAIKGGPAPGSNFDYAADLTELVLLGALAQRNGTTVVWDAKNMRVMGQPQFDAWIKEPARKGWDYKVS